MSVMFRSPASFSTRVARCSVHFCSVRRFVRLDRGCERGQATAEYGVVILIAVALGMAVLTLFTGGVFDSFLGTLVKHVLKAATDKIDFT